MVEVVIITIGNTLRTYLFGMAMTSHPGHGRAAPTDEEQEAIERCRNKHIGSGRGATRYNRLIHHRSASLDLEIVFQQIKISREIKPETCKNCKQEKCQCPAFDLGTPCPSASSTPTHSSTDKEEVPQLVLNTETHVLYPPVQSPSDEEADAEVATICRRPVSYRMIQSRTRRQRYYMYNSLDAVAENRGQKCRQDDSPPYRGDTVMVRKNVQKQTK